MSFEPIDASRGSFGDSLENDVLHASEALENLSVSSSARLVDAKFMPSKASHSKRCGLALLFGAPGGCKRMEDLSRTDRRDSLLTDHEYFPPLEISVTLGQVEPPGYFAGVSSSL
ncbi:MAG: hypothetical protein Q9204_007538 [Flavoplaca sp. TL-2023a]